MNQQKYVFSQITEYISYYDFDKCVELYNGDKYVRELSCRDQFLSMMFGQLCHRESLRDLIISLNAHKNKLYHLGFRCEIKLPTLAKANEKRDYRIYENLAKILINKAQNLYIDDSSFPFKFKGKLYIIDSSTIDLCLSIFKWAKFRKTKSAVKLHTQIDGNGIIPTVISVTNADIHDVNFLDMIDIEPNAHYVMDRGYLDFARLHKIHISKAFFVIRAKSNAALKRIYSNKVDKLTSIKSDQVVKLTGYYTRKAYPEKLRRIKYYDKENDRHYIFLTNDMNMDASVVADIYKYRWQIELFFKWVKQHLKIVTFWGRSANAVKTQIYIAICTYLIVLIMKKKLKIKIEGYKMLQILSISLFDKTPIKSLFTDVRLQEIDCESSNQLSLLSF